MQRLKNIQNNKNKIVCESAETIKFNYTVSKKTSKIIFVITTSNFHQIWQFWHNDGKLSKIIWGAFIFHLT